MSSQKLHLHLGRGRVSNSCTGVALTLNRKYQRLLLLVDKAAYDFTCSFDIRVCVSASLIFIATLTGSKFVATPLGFLNLLSFSPSQMVNCKVKAKNIKKLGKKSICMQMK